MNSNITIYKDSPIGIIPSDWEIKELRNAELIIIDGDRGNNYPSENELLNEGYCLFMNAKNVTNNGFSFIGNSFITKEKDEGLRKGKLQRFDLVLTTRGTVGNIAFYDESIPFDHLRINSGMVLIRNKNGRINNEFIYKCFNSFIVQNQIKKIAFGSAQPQLTVKEILKLKVPIPSLSEQKAIAHVLGLMDSAINTNNKLIAKNELQKKWLMQNLLTGKKRLKGFSEEWNEYKFKDCFHFIKSYSISRDGLSREQGKQYCIHYGDIHAYYETDFIDFKTQSGIPRIIVNNIKVHPADYLQDGDIIIADASEDYEGVGEAVEVINIQDKIVVGGLHTIVLRDFSGVTFSLFRAYLFNSESVRNELRKKATGTSVYSVTKTTLESLVFKLPPLKEQRSIAMVLQAADKEIQLLKAKSEKLREQKKGLMQVLLTGKKRLTVISPERDMHLDTTYRV